MYRLHARVAGKGWGFRGWDYWDTGTDFVTHFTGRVVANLADPEGKHVRCKFQLVHPWDESKTMAPILFAMSNLPIEGDTTAIASNSIALSCRD